MSTIAFTGDIAFTKFFSQSCSDENLLSEKVVDFLASSDYTVVNMEGSVSSGEVRSDKPLTHANPPECVEWIKKVNGNIWNLANNHSMDCKEDGLISTLEIAKKNNFLTIGAGMNGEEAQKPIFIDEAGGIGIISVTYFRQNRADDKTSGCFVADDEEIIKNHELYPGGYGVLHPDHRHSGHDGTAGGQQAYPGPEDDRRAVHRRS